MGRSVNKSSFNGRPTRRSRVENCSTCATDPNREKLMPPHDASNQCESGKRDHCSCDTCF